MKLKYDNSIIPIEVLIPNEYEVAYYYRWDEGQPNWEILIEPFPISNFTDRVVYLLFMIDGVERGVKLDVGSCYSIYNENEELVAKINYGKLIRREELLLRGEIKEYIIKALTDNQETYSRTVWSVVCNYRDSDVVRDVVEKRETLLPITMLMVEDFLISISQQLIQELTGIRDMKLILSDEVNRVWKK